MKNKLKDDNLISRFLLGDVADEQKAQVEELFFNDDEYFDYLLAMEDELIDDYAQGALSPRERQLFETHFLNSPERRSRVEFAQALQKTADRAGAAEMTKARVEDEKKSWWQALLSIFGAQNSMLQMAMAAATVVLMLGCAFLVYESARLRNQLTQAETARVQKEKEAAEQVAAQHAKTQQLTNDLERERLEREQLEQELAQEKARHEKASSTQGGFGALASFILSAGLVRDDQGAKRLAIPASAEQVRLQLTLRRTGDYQSYRASLKTLDGAELGKAAARKAGNAVVVNLSSKLLKAGDYRLMLSGVNATGEVEEIDSYYFSVVKK